MITSASLRPIVAGFQQMGSALPYVGGSWNCKNVHPQDFNYKFAVEFVRACFQWRMHRESREVIPSSHKIFYYPVLFCEADQGGGRGGGGEKEKVRILQAEFPRLGNCSAARTPSSFPSFISWIHVSIAGSQIISDGLNVLSMISCFFFNFIKICKKKDSTLCIYDRKSVKLE